jgi:hypothetical protein
MSERNHDCDLVHQLWEAETVGRLLSRSEAELVAEHLTGCTECRLEADALATLDLDHPTGPPPYVEGDVARRRWIDDAIGAAGRPRADRPASNRGWLVGLAAAVLLVATGGVVTWAVLGGNQATSAPLPTVTADAPAALEGRVVLVSGETTESHELLEPGSPLPLGEMLSAGNGALVVELATGITVLLDEGARARVERLDQERVAVALTQGRLFGAVDPDRQGPLFEVTTEGGVVRVTGTVFAVQVAGAAASVEVYRGQVTVGEADGAERGVEVGQRVVLGRPGRERLARETEDRVLATLKMLDLLDPAGQSTIELRSLPGGAAVMLDAVAVGATPLEAAVRPGHRIVELSLAGHLPVRELLELGQGDRLSRVFDLTRAETDADDIGETVTAAARPAPARQQTAAELLTRAQEQRAARDVRGAAATYNKLIKSHPGSPEAHAALVSLGTIQLDRLGQPGRALGLFDRYLARSRRGTLAQEAAYGRARALQALGRRQAEIDGLRQFLTTYPGAVQAGLARQRLAEIDPTD